MSRTQLILASLVVVLAIGLGLAWLWWALHTAPEFYRTAIGDVAMSADHVQVAQSFTHDALAFANSIEYADHWSRDCTEHQVNCWLAEELPRRFAAWVPDGIQHPRVEFSRDRVQLGFLGQRGFWKGVVSVTLQPRMLAPNQLALRIEAVRAGLIRIPLDRLLSVVKPDTLKHRWRIEWRQDPDCDVAVIDLDSAGSEALVLQSVVVDDQALKLSGSRRELVQGTKGDEASKTMRAAGSAHSGHR